MQMALARWGVWFRRGWPWWWSVGFALAGLLALRYLPTTEDNLRRVGMVYETLGMLLVLLEVAAATKKHGLQWPWQRFARYWRENPLKKAPGIYGTLNVVDKGKDVVAAWGTVSAPAGATLEQRVACLEQKLQEVEGSVHRVNARVETEERNRADADKAEAAARTQAVDQLRGTIKDLEIGSLDLTVFGLVWLFVGMVMTTGTPELCMVLHCVAG
jgi:hypothetical protein